MGFEACHPAVNLIFFVTVIAGAIVFQHPVYLAISFLCAFAYSVKRNGVKAVIFNLCLLPAIVVFALYYSSYNHFGITNLARNFIGNQLTLESIVYGFVLGFSVAAVMIWMSCVYAVFSSDKMVYLFGRVWPGLSLFLAIMLRMVPRIKTEARRINKAQQGIGRGANQGNIFQRLRNCVCIFSVLVTWTIESLTTMSDSMRNRGSSLRGRTAFSIYRFDNRDRAYVVALFAVMTVTLVGVLLHQIDMVYDPRIIFPAVTPMSYVFWAGYAVLCLMPLMLELWTDYCFRRARKAL